MNCAYSIICGFCHITDDMAFVQKAEKKPDLDNMMNEVQEKIEEKDSEFAILWDNVISLNFNDTQMVELRKLNQFVYVLFTQRKKKALAIARKCLIFNVGHLGLEPRTSRLWVSQSDIPWDFVVCNVRQGTQVDDRSNEEAYSWGQWNVSSLFSAFCSLMFPSFHVFGTKVRQNTIFYLPFSLNMV